MKLVVIDHVYLEESHLHELRTLGELKVFPDPPHNETEVKERMHDADVVIVGWTQLTKEVIDSAQNLKMISIWATTCHYADLNATERRGVVVSHVPAYGTEAVAEHAFALLFAAARKIVLEDASVREGKFDWRPFTGLELAGKTLGIVGTGAIGRRVAVIAKSFGMRVLGYDIQHSAEAAKVGITYVDFETLLEQSDVVSLHVTMTPTTQKLIGENELRRMKRGAILINTSQGQVVDEKALVEALSEGRLSCAGLDVFEKEPPDKTNPLFMLENVILTPHIGFCTSEALKRCSDICVDNVKKYLDGHPQNVCLPS